MTKIKKLLHLLKKVSLKSFIKLKLPLNAKVKIDQKELYFHDVADSSITEQILLNGYQSYEPELVKLFENYPFEYEHFIDAGANIGFYSILMHEVFGNKIQITAIEPFPANIEYMRTFQRNNKIDFKILPCALSEQDGEQKEFYVPTTHRSSKLPPAASLINNFGTKGALFEKDKFKKIMVETVSLLSVLDNTKAPHLMKLDIEGYELPVLTSIENYLTKTSTLDLVVEIMINDKDKQAIFDLLISCGFDAYLITNAGLIGEDRPLTLPYYNQNGAKLRTCWKNHYFTKRSADEITALSQSLYGYAI
jgi:FkbM family methyltransferase